MDTLYQIGATIINILIRSKLGGDRSDNYIDIVTTLKELGLEMGEARQVKRGFEVMGDALAEACRKVIERSNVASERKSAIVENVLKAYEALNIDYEFILQFINKEDELRKRLLNANCEYKKELDPIEIEQYERLLDYTAHFVVNASISMPEFN